MDDMDKLNLIGNKTSFSKKILGKKNSTRMMPHRVSIKFYENGIVLKPIGKQGICVASKEENNIENQKAIFLTNECAEYLALCIDGHFKAPEIAKALEESN